LYLRFVKINITMVEKKQQENRQSQPQQETEEIDPIEYTRKAFSGPTPKQLEQQAQARARGGLTEMGIRKFKEKAKRISTEKGVTVEVAKEAIVQSEREKMGIRKIDRKTPRVEEKSKKPERKEKTFYESLGAVQRQSIGDMSIRPEDAFRLQRKESIQEFRESQKKADSEVQKKVEQAKTSPDERTTINIERDLNKGQGTISKDPELPFYLRNQQRKDLVVEEKPSILKKVLRAIETQLTQKGFAPGTVRREQLDLALSGLAGTVFGVGYASGRSALGQISKRASGFADLAMIGVGVQPTADITYEVVTKANKPRELAKSIAPDVAFLGGAIGSSFLSSTPSSQTQKAFDFFRENEPSLKYKAETVSRTFIDELPREIKTGSGKVLGKEPGVTFKVAEEVPTGKILIESLPGETVYSKGFTTPEGSTVLRQYAEIGKPDKGLYVLETITEPKGLSRYKLSRGGKQLDSGEFKVSDFEKVYLREQSLPIEKTQEFIAPDVTVKNLISTSELKGASPTKVLLGATEQTKGLYARTVNPASEKMFTKFKLTEAGVKPIEGTTEILSTNILLTKGKSKLPSRVVDVSSTGSYYESRPANILVDVKKGFKSEAVLGKGKLLENFKFGVPSKVKQPKTQKSQKIQDILSSDTKKLNTQTIQKVKTTQKVSLPESVTSTKKINLKVPKEITKNIQNSLVFSKIKKTPFILQPDKQNEKINQKVFSDQKPSQKQKDKQKQRQRQQTTSIQRQFTPQTTKTVDITGQPQKTSQPPKQEIVPKPISGLSTVPLISTKPTITTRLTPTPSVPRVPVPTIPLIGLPPKPKGGRRPTQRKPSQVKEEGYNAYVKRKQTKKGKGKYISRGFTKVNKEPLSRKAALGLAMSIADNYVNRSIRVKETKKPVSRKRPALVNRYNRLRSKFRESKKSKNILVEKSTFAIDSRNEIRGIPYESIRQRRKSKTKTKTLKLI